MVGGRRGLMVLRGRVEVAGVRSDRICAPSLQNTCQMWLEERFDMSPNDRGHSV